MKQYSLFILCIIFSGQLILAQDKYITRTGEITFFSHSPLEDIKAVNHKVTCIFDSQTGEVVSSLYMENFEFRKSLMQTHFNDNYVESHIYPKATFYGTIKKIDQLNLESGQKSKAAFTGQLSIHGVTKEINADVSFEKNNKKLIAKTEFIARPADFEIEIPALLRDNIAKEILVSVEFVFEALNN